MTEIEVFRYPATGQEIRMLIREDGTPLFCHADACKGLQHSNPSVAIKLVEDDDKILLDLAETDSPNLNRTSINSKMWFLTEPGFYDLSIASQAPGAKAFKRWITHDVLPTLRKTGRYELVPSAPQFRLPQTYAAALRELASTVDERDEARAELAVVGPKAEAWDTLASAEGDFAVADAAKILSRDPAIKLGRDRLFTYLKEIGWAHRQRSDGRWRAYQTQVDRRRLSEIPESHYHPRTGELVIDPPQVRVTVKGLHDLHRRLGGTKQLEIPMHLAPKTVAIPTQARPSSRS